MKTIEYSIPRKEIIELVEKELGLKGDWMARLSSKGLILWKTEK